MQGVHSVAVVFIVQGVHSVAVVCVVQWGAVVWNEVEVLCGSH